MPHDLLPQYGTFPRVADSSDIGVNCLAVGRWDIYRQLVNRSGQQRRRNVTGGLVDVGQWNGDSVVQLYGDVLLHRSSGRVSNLCSQQPLEDMCQ